MEKVEKTGKNRYSILNNSGEEVAKIYLQEDMFDSQLEQSSLAQLIDASKLPGVVHPVLGMPDIHTGFGLPIGGVMATDSETGIISAGAVGMDINCGVRLVRTGIEVGALNKGNLQNLIHKIEKAVPLGVGKKTNIVNDKKLIENVIKEGVPALIDKGYGSINDLKYIEDSGFFPGANLKNISSKALKRADQLGTLGGGNHFIEFGLVDDIFDKEIASAFDLNEGELTLMIHTGSRGFGHQICKDYSSIMEKKSRDYNILLPNKGLACVPIKSPEGEAYLSAMAGATNFAFANRHLIYIIIKEILESKFSNFQSLNIRTVYDVAHNIAKFEINDGKNILIHRKGATRALPKGHKNCPTSYKNQGQPAIIPGSMGTSSYVVVGTEKTAETFWSVNHGAGRIMSRTAARKNLTESEFKKSMDSIVFQEDKAIKLLDEAPMAYKDIDGVIDTLSEIGITKKVVKLKPLAVIKGDN